MRKIITFVLLMSVSLITRPLGAQNNPLKSTDIVPQLENILMDLSSNINQKRTINDSVHCRPIASHA